MLCVSFGSAEDMFSDEPWLPDAEAKIWREESRLRFRTSEGFKDFAMHGSVATCLGQSLASLPVPRLRLAGHSLGAPLAIRAAQQSRAELRIALLDPFWSRRMPVVNPQSYLSTASSTSQESLKIALQLDALHLA